MRAIRPLSIFVTLSVLILIGLFELSRSREFQVFGKLYSHGPTDQPNIALTFDDGPTPQHIDKVLQILADRQILATFFLTGREIEAYPELAARIAAAGHELGNHSYSHQRFLRKPQSFIDREIARTDALIRQAGYDGPIAFRPPYGKKLFGLPWYLWQRDRVTVMWTQEPDSDQTDATAAAIADRTIRNASNGDIILLHVMYDSRDASVAALPLILDGLRARGFRFTTVSDLLSLQNQP